MICGALKLARQFGDALVCVRHRIDEKGEVNRLLDLNHASRMEHLESAARSLGREIRLSVV